MGTRRKKRCPAGSVCKPCWELKYCPYGQLVEMFPGPGTTRTPEQVIADYQAILAEFTAGTLKTEDDIWSAIARLEYHVPWTTEEIRDYDQEEVGCRIFGHACPVFWCKAARPKRRKAGQLDVVFLARSCSRWCAAITMYAKRVLSTFRTIRSSLTT